MHGGERDSAQVEVHLLSYRSYPLLLDSDGHPEGVYRLLTEQPRRGLDQPGRVYQVGDSLLLGQDLRPRHTLQEVPRSACVVEVDVGGYDVVDIGRGDAQT